MKLTNEQLQNYKDKGFVLLQQYFLPDEVNLMKAELPVIFAEDTPGRILEEEGNAVRAVYGSHSTNEVCQRLSQHPRLVEPAMQLLGSNVYTYQFKINAKAAFRGDIWEWHQDYIFWRQEDGLPTSRVVNSLLLLDEMNEFNGPLFIIPDSHKEGTIDIAARSVLGTNKHSKPKQDSPPWMSNITANLKYSLSQDLVSSLVLKYGILSIKAPAGSVLFFDSNIIHASPNNISPFDRAIVLITYNSVENIPFYVENPRPDFIVSRDYSPIEPLSDNALSSQDLK